MAGFGNGDYLDYTVTVPAGGGTYTVNFRVADGGSVGAVQLLQNNGTTPLPVLSSSTVPQTGGPQIWVTAAGPQFALPAGTQTIRVYCQANGWSLNWIELVQVNTSAPPGNTAVQMGNGYDGGSLISGVNNSFTVEEWVNPTLPQTLIPVGSSGDGYSGANFTWYPSSGWQHAGMGIAVGTNGVCVFENSGAGTLAVISWAGTVSGWTHIAVVYNNLTPSLYVNGQLVATGATSASAWVSPSDMIFGGYYNNMQGMVDEIRVWNYPRSQQQLQASMQQYVAVPASGLVAYWQINATDGGTVHDITGNGHDKPLPTGYSIYSPGASYTTNAPPVSAAGASATAGCRYGMNGQEKSDEIGDGLYTAEYWEYDSRIGRRWNVDPIRKEYQSPYATFGNNPIWRSDPNGAKDSATTTDNAQASTLLDAAKIAANQVREGVKNKYVWTTLTKEIQHKLIAASMEYYKQHQDWNAEDFVIFTGVVIGYYKELSWVARWSSHDFNELDYAAINTAPGNLTSSVGKLSILNAGIEDSREGRFGIIGSGANAALFIASAALFPEVGNGPRGTQINLQTQQAIVNLGKPQLRRLYEAEVQNLSTVAQAMRADGSTSEEIARIMWSARRQIGIKYKNLTPPELLKTIYERNLAKYGD